MSAYINQLRQEKKVELSQKVSLSLVNDIIEMSQMVEDAQEFVDYLMTITDHRVIEEFFNQCHDAGGRFCGGSGGSGSGPVVGRSTVPKGAVTKHGLNLGIAEQNNVYNKVAQRRKSSQTFNSVTRPASIKLNKLAKTNLSKFSDDDLKVLNTLAGIKQRENKVWSRVSLGIAATLVAVTANPVAAPINTTLFVAESIQSKRYKTQGQRIKKELARRKVKSTYLSTELESIEEFAAVNGLSEEDKALLPNFKAMLDELIQDNDGDFSDQEIIDLRNLRAAADKV